MATERLIDANALLAKFERIAQKSGIPHFTLDEIADEINEADAVEVDDMREFAKDVVYQFGCYWVNGGRLHITHGGLSTLEWAFDILGWDDPHPVPECECEIDGCHEHATCGAPTNDGYKRMCGKHCRERRKNG